MAPASRRMSTADNSVAAGSWLTDPQTLSVVQQDLPMYKLLTVLLASPAAGLQTVLTQTEGPLGIRAVGNNRGEYRCAGRLK